MDHYNSGSSFLKTKTNNSSTRNLRNKFHCVSLMVMYYCVTGTWRTCVWRVWECVTWGLSTEQTSCCRCQKDRHTDDLQCEYGHEFVGWSPARNVFHNLQMYTAHTDTHGLITHMDKPMSNCPHQIYCKTCRDRCPMVHTGSTLLYNVDRPIYPTVQCG